MSHRMAMVAQGEKPVSKVVCHLPFPARTRIVIIILCIFTRGDAFSHGCCPNTRISFMFEKPEWRGAVALCCHPFLTTCWTGSRLWYDTCDCIGRNDSMLKTEKFWCNIFYPALVFTFTVYAGTIVTYLKPTTKTITYTQQ